MKYKVYFVGAGPGDPGLITLKGLELLHQADVVIYDYLVNRRILSNTKEGAELICCDRLGKKRYSDGFLIHQEKINQLIVEKVKQGKKVVRLKNGDISIFSRLSQELEFLTKEKIDFALVPGVTAASGASCYTGIPLTDRRFASTCAFVTAHEDPAKKNSYLDWNALSKIGTVILYMAAENLESIVKKLIQAGKPKDTACAIIHDATLFTQKIIIGTLKDIAVRAKEKKIVPPAIVIIGEVVRLERKFNWLRKNRRILFTGLSKERFFLKDIYFHFPLIKIVPLKDYTKFDTYLKDIQRFDWIVFTSRYAVEYFFKRLAAIGFDARALKGIQIAAIGNSTKNRLREFTVSADLMPKEESSKGLIKEFKKLELKGKEIFLPRSDIADKGLIEALKKLQAEVVACVAYRNIMPANLPDLDLRFFNEIMFTSPSGVCNFIKRYKRVPDGVKVSCIGEVTQEEAKKWNLLN